MVFGEDPTGRSRVRQARFTAHEVERLFVDPLRRIAGVGGVEFDGAGLILRLHQTRIVGVGQDDAKGLPQTASVECRVLPCLP